MVEFTSRAEDSSAAAPPSEPSPKGPRLATTGNANASNLVAEIADFRGDVRGRAAAADHGAPEHLDAESQRRYFLRVNPLTIKDSEQQ
jgi:hypothetical protein